MPRTCLALLLLLLNFTDTQGQLCTIQYLPALQIINMREDLQPGDLVTRLAIIGTSSEISTRLLYNSSEVRTNGSNYFRLNFTDLYLTSTLDYEWWTLNNYSNPFVFIVECTILSDQSVVLVNFQLDLIDANDHPPRFPQSVYRVNVTENTTINSIVSTDITAYDLDTGPNALFFFYLLNDSSSYLPYFRLLNATNASLVLVKALDYNTMNSTSNLTVVVQDVNNASLATNATIVITLIDVDNLNPIFAFPSYNLNISIDTALNSVVTPNEGPVFAYDQDRGINQSILYSIVTPNPYFSIDNRTAALTVRSLFNSTLQLDLLIEAEQDENPNRTATSVLHVNVFEVNNYPPRFSNTPYQLLGYATLDQIPIFNGSVTDNDTTPRESYASTCDSSLLNLQITKTGLRDFQIQLVYTGGLPVCQPCVCVLNVSDGRYTDQTNLTVRLFNLASFSTDSSIYSVDFSSTLAPILISAIQNNTAGVCSIRYFAGSVWNSLFSITSTGNLSWSNPSVIPSQSAYELRVGAEQNCSSLLQNVSKDIIVNFRNLPSSTVAPSSSSSSGLDSTTVYAIIASVAAFILIVVAILFIVLYYRIQRAKHRVPPFFQSRKHSPAHGLTFLKSKSPLTPSSPYILDVRDDDSSNSTSSDRTTSSPLHNRLLSGHYKVTEPPVNTTIEELLSSYDNRSTSSSSSSSGLADLVLSPTFQPPLDTINEDLQWMNNSSRPLNSSRVSRPSDDAMDIISESHESSISGSATEVGTSVSTLLQQQAKKRNTLTRNINEYLTVFV